MENERTLKDVLHQFVKTKPIRDKYELLNIKEVWKKCLGKTIDQYTSDIRYFSGTLTVVITSAPLRQELNFGKDKLKKLLNEELGKDVIHEIKIF